MRLTEAQTLLDSIDQGHLLRYWDILSDEDKTDLLSQISKLDVPMFREEQRLINATETTTSPIAPFTDFDMSGNEADIQSGKQMIAQGLIGCLIVAGGQGTRLRFDGPKGLFPITAIKQKTLFQLFVEKTVAASKQARRPLPIAIMTSLQNHAATVQYFEENDRFGLEKEQLSFFTQESLPLLDQSGNLFLETPSTIAEGPDGNGGALHHFYHSGIWQEWHRRGVRYLNFIVIDNPLADPFDAELLGYQERLGSDVVVKCTLKRHAQEKVGVLAKEKDKVVVVEYSEMSDSEKTAVDDRDSLSYCCANLSLFCFQMDAIQRLAKFSMPLHKAFKAVKYLDEEGKIVQPDKPMSWKFEKFIFDILPHVSKVDALLYPREVCFAPLKNHSGDDSIETVRRALQEADRRAYKSVTGTEPPKNIEVSQDFHYPTPELIAKWRGKTSHSRYIEAD